MFLILSFLFVLLIIYLFQNKTHAYKVLQHLVTLVYPIHDLLVCDINARTQKKTFTFWWELK